MTMNEELKPFIGTDPAYNNDPATTVYGYYKNGVVHIVGELKGQEAEDFKAAYTRPEPQVFDAEAFSNIDKLLDEMSEEYEELNTSNYGYEDVCNLNNAMIAIGNIEVELKKEIAKLKQALTRPKAEADDYKATRGILKEFFEDKPQPPKAVDVEGLKKEVGNPMDDGLGLVCYQRGWNGCIDHLHTQGLLGVPDFDVNWSKQFYAYFRDGSLISTTNADLYKLVPVEPLLTKERMNDRKNTCIRLSQ